MRRMSEMAYGFEEWQSTGGGGDSTAAGGLKMDVSQWGDAPEQGRLLENEGF